MVLFFSFLLRIDFFSDLVIDNLTPYASIHICTMQICTLGQVFKVTCT